MLKSGSSTRGYPYPPTASKHTADEVTEVMLAQWDAPQHGWIPAGSQLTLPNGLLHMLTSQITPSDCYLDLY